MLSLLGVTQPTAAAALAQDRSGGVAHWRKLDYVRLPVPARAPSASHRDIPEAGTRSYSLLFVNAGG